MARWLVKYASSSEGLVPTSQSWVVLLSTLIVFCICVSTLLALCAVHSNPKVNDLNVHTDQSSAKEPEGELAMESRKLSHRFSSTAVITKLSASFRVSSFRDPPSFRISSFRADSRAQGDLVDALRRSRGAVVEDIDTEPAVWQRAILRGERCAPLSFSGLILYDVHGNPLPNHTTTEVEDLGNSQ
ncbi:hypothetical protein KC19_3G139800 [Ceratodon purpureus]|uniref:Uncharacterized protein n=1 Tax=Ceratodon purpureus TaxID=3225 RepID=A0A8T0IJL5_CERPU|nr:hypothetical protein KC19_3G139800 [Ceratodon purpureus]KAG0583483.1 hypothetical protein KC19_3G139800 [Ceratodon purpureus]